MLGPLELQAAGGPVDIGGSRQQRVLAALLVQAGEAVSSERLVEQVWDEGERPENGVDSVRTYVSRLRRAIEAAGDAADVLVTEPGAYRLDVNGHGVDSEILAVRVAQGRQLLQDGDAAGAVATFDRALRLWRGRPYGAFADEPWARAEVARLDELRLVALEERVEARLAIGSYGEVVAELERLIGDQPLRDRLRGQLMVGLYRAGRQAEALRAYQDYREFLRLETGLDPSEELQSLERRIASDDASLQFQDSGRPLRAYRLSDRLGEGAFSIVWRGVQPALGREVAVKQIRAELANRPEFIRHFEAEAHLVARLEHPYIVPLYDYWREPDSAYLVFRYLRGGSLSSSLLDGPWSLERTARMVEQVGAALATAHRAGVVHRDVKPENVLLDEEGNTYLTDFGIAVEAAELDDPDAALSAGSPAYASPEQLRRQPVGPGADVHGLGIVIYEALTGQLPFPDEVTQAGLLARQLSDAVPSVRSIRPDLSPAVDEVIQQATAKVVGDRYVDVSELVQDFSKLLAERTVERPRRPGMATAIGDGVNPYKALRPFDEADADDFCGRDRLVDQLVDRLDESRLITILGPSGSGKSSVARAGLVPALRRGSIPTSEQWFVTSMLPGTHPFEELETALLRVAVNPPSSLLEQLSADERGIARAVRRILPDDGTELLVLIDQFEELFTLCDDDGLRRRFLAGLRAALTDDRSRLRVVATIRARLLRPSPASSRDRHTHP